MNGHRIGKVSKMLGVSIDTLRYYEKFGLLPQIGRTNGGARLYTPADVSRLEFILRAQRMKFTLAEIKQLLALRDHPSAAQPEVLGLSRNKLEEIEDHLRDLASLRDELHQLVGLCASSGGDCPILERMDTGSPAVRSIEGPPQGMRLRARLPRITGDG